MNRAKEDSAEAANEKPLCFVVGPIGDIGSEIHKGAFWLLKGLFVPVMESQEFGYRVKRADQDPRPGSISDAVIADIFDAEIVIADLTGDNPNAFYEVGLRHMTAKPIIHVTTEGARLPFDNIDQRTIFVDRSDFNTFEEAKLQLAEAVRAIRAPGFRVSNPVTRARAVIEFTGSADTTERLVADINARMGALEAMVVTSPQFAPMSSYAHVPVGSVFDGPSSGPERYSVYLQDLAGPITSKEKDDIADIVKFFSIPSEEIPLINAALSGTRQLSSSELATVRSIIARYKRR